MLHSYWLSEWAGLVHKTFGPDLHLMARGTSSTGPLIIIIIIKNTNKTATTWSRIRRRWWRWYGLNGGQELWCGYMRTRLTASIVTLLILISYKRAMRSVQNAERRHHQALQSDVVCLWTKQTNERTNERTTIESAVHVCSASAIRWLKYLSKIFKSVWSSVHVQTRHACVNDFPLTIYRTIILTACNGAVKNEGVQQHMQAHTFRITSDVDNDW